jgi:hypothetical protein
MNISERFSDGFKFITERLWIIFIPILLDLANLFSWKKVYHTVYIPAEKMFMIKLGFIGAPPSVNFMLEDFPSTLLKYDNNGLSGIINKFSLFNAALFLTVMLVTSFLNSGYMSIIGTSYKEKVSIGDFFVKGNKKWAKFFLLDIITWFPIILTIYDRDFTFLSYVNIIFVYVKYSFVTDEVSILKNFKLGIAFLINNLVLTIKMALYFGLSFSLLSLVVLQLARLGTVGIIIDIIICAYVGAVTNKAVLEIYAAERNR